MFKYIPSLLQTNMQDIPGEISLIVPVKGCKYNCKKCHTPQLQENTPAVAKSLAPGEYGKIIKGRHTC
ncbi:MAG: hypothetical protein LBB08_00485, partial [Rickettsiales bacterium]|nr:hypothetical protein [Rickettsiales bacterium]